MLPYYLYMIDLKEVHIMQTTLMDRHKGISIEIVNKKETGFFEGRVSREQRRRRKRFKFWKH